MNIVNFAHPLTAENLTQIGRLTGLEPDRVLDVPSQIDVVAPLVPQLEDMVADIDLTAIQWQAEPLVVNLPSLNYSAAIVLSLLQGRIGHFPSILRLRPDPWSAVPRFEVAEIINLQAARDAARSTRG